ncbi:phospholipid phosphatase 1-like isoform X1 [Neodiprion virginianus]|uniref:phospholipid phosphatase 1-like isoform X1 n=1 Tax=Neodiprion virginianus TaxID=2961670 RepID=UPI001EE7386C|nr:phospholipid phosphatase 1-like isoform X1 [Neodiprion virginianus]
MVHMHVTQTSSPNISTVIVEVDGGIRNPACQDDLHDNCYSERQDCQSISRPTTNKSTELLTIQSIERLDDTGVVGNTVDPTGTSSGSKGAREKIMNACRSLWNWRLLIDILIVVTVFVFIGVVEFGIFPQQQIGFYCNDPGLSFKFTGDTISYSVLLGCSVILPLIVMWLAEWSCYKPDSYKSLRPGCVGTRGKQIWTWYGHYATACVTITCVLQLVKTLVGAPRPHFFDTCKPREMYNCTETYVQYYTCTNTETSTWVVSDASKSFPSGHSILSTYTSVYIIWYLQKRLPNRALTTLFKPWMQCLVLCWGIVCCMTRLSDHRHHWWDVLAGIIMGIAAGFYCVKVNCKEFVLKDDSSDWARGESVENGHHGYDNRRHQSVRKLLSNTSVENREMGDVVTPSWKE